MKKIIYSILPFCILFFAGILCNNAEAQNTKALASNSVIDTVFSKKLECSIISRGDNFPDRCIKRDSVYFLFAALHKNIDVEDFAVKANFSRVKTDSILSLLESKNLVHKINGIFKPTIFMDLAEDGKNLFSYASPISEQIANIIEKNLSGIKRDFSKMKMAQNSNFEHWSFFILSDVLLDNWQINNVERDFLSAPERPLRHGKNYYCRISERNSVREAFGIYGNQSGDISVYGNNRNNCNLSETENVVSASDNEMLEIMAQKFLPKLLKVLENNRAYMENIYVKSSYSNEITFNEFCIWWYHFIYTQTTDLLASRGVLQIPENGNFVYKF